MRSFRGSGYACSVVFKIQKRRVERTGGIGLIGGGGAKRRRTEEDELGVVERDSEREEKMRKSERSDE